MEIEFSAINRFGMEVLMYFAFSIIKFKNNLRNKFNIFVEILETLLFFIVYMYVFKALFKGHEKVEGYTFEMVITSILIIICMADVYINHELFIQKKMKEGALLTELMKPVDFITRILFEDIGNVVFKICFLMTPVILIVSSFTSVMKPHNISCLLISLISAILGFLIYWHIGLLVNEITFFEFSVWALVVIKNGIINVFGGMLLPIWFLPDAIKEVLYFTPIPYLFQVPVDIYLGMYSGKEIVCLLLIQLIWVVSLYCLGRFIWNKGLDKILKRGV